MSLLNNICELRKETCSPHESNSQIYVGLEHIDSGRFFLSRHGSPAQVRSAKSRFYPGDVLYGKLRPYLDKAVVAETEGICSTDILVLEPTEVPPWFLCGVLHSDAFIEHAKQTTHGVNHPRTSWSGIKVFETLSLGLLERRKIAAVLLKIQRAIETQGKIIQSLRDLKKSTMQHLFTHGLRGEKTKMTEIGEMPESWEVKKIDEILGESLYGLSMRGQTSGSYPILRMNCQIDGAVVFDNLQYVDLDPKTYEKFRLVDGDLLFNRTNSHDLVGRMAIFHATREVVFASYLIRLRFDRQSANPDFVNYYFNMNATQTRVRTLASRGVSQSNINASKLKTFEIPLSSDLEEQADIISNLKAVDSKVRLHESKKSALQDLFKTTLNKLMTGEIRVNDLDIDVSKMEV